MIKTVVTTYGEYIGDIDEGADVIVIKKPRMVILGFLITITSAPSSMSPMYSP